MSGEKKQQKNKAVSESKTNKHLTLPHPLNVVLENCVNVVIHPSVLFRKIIPIFTSLFQNAHKYKNQPADDAALAELLEWVGWVRGEMEEFLHLL